MNAEETDYENEDLREWARRHASKARWVQGSKAKMDAMLFRARELQARAETTLEEARTAPHTSVVVQKAVAAAAIVGVGYLIGRWWANKNKPKQTKKQPLSSVPAFMAPRLVPKSASEMPAWAVT